MGQRHRRPAQLGPSHSPLHSALGPAASRVVSLPRPRCYGAAAASVAASLHAAAGARAPALRVLLRGGGKRGRRPRRLQPLCDGRRGTLEHLLHGGQPGGPRGYRGSRAGLEAPGTPYLQCGPPLGSQGAVWDPAKARLGLSAAEEITPRFRAACEQQAVTFALREDGASLTLSGGPWALDFELSKVPGPEAASRLRALTLGLAEQVCNLKRQLAGLQVTATSPKKSPCLAGPQFFLPDPDPQRGGPGLGVRRRCPGESLINPGFKSKKPASGVDFDSP